jgi:hypothetical protein
MFLSFMCFCNKANLFLPIRFCGGESGKIETGCKSVRMISDTIPTVPVRAKQYPLALTGILIEGPDRQRAITEPANEISLQIVHEADGKVIILLTSCQLSICPLNNDSNTLIKSFIVLGDPGHAATEDLNCIAAGAHCQELYQLRQNGRLRWP